MADLPRPSVALRVMRPYTSEEELIRGDLRLIGRSWIVLAGVTARAMGDLVRFEIILQSGQPVIRAEGIVIAFHEQGSTKPPGLELKISRIDARSKAILDRAYAVRVALAKSADNRASDDTGPASRLSLPPESPPESIPPSPSRAFTRRGPVPPPPDRHDALARLRDRAKGLALPRVLAKTADGE